MAPDLKLNENAKQLLKHKFTGEGGEEYEGTEFGGFGQYIANKVIKLQNQAQEYANDKDKSDIFHGCIIYITGYTKPSIFELKRLITLNGGVHAQYLTGKTSVTHIIATSLTARKRIEFSKFKVVKPEWVVNSVKEGKLLPWSEYRTIDVKSTLKFIGGSGKGQENSSSSSQLGVRSIPPTLKPVHSNESLKSPSKLLLKSSSPSTSPIKRKESSAQILTSPVKVPPKFTPKEIPTTTSNYASEFDDESDDEELNELFAAIPVKRIRPEEDGVGNTKKARIEGNSKQDNKQIEKDTSNITTKIVQGEVMFNKEVDLPPVDIDVVPVNDTGLDGLVSDLLDKQTDIAADDVLSNMLSDDESDIESDIQLPPDIIHNLPQPRYLNCLHPDFIPSYYRNSRLHHLSTWKAELRKKFQHLAEEQNKKSQGRSKQSNNRIIFHVDYDSFFVSVALLNRPDLRDEPVCISNGSSGNSDVASCNYAARKFGVRNGMWVTQAKKKCPNLICLNYNFSEYEKASESLYQVLIDNDPDYLFPVSVDEALIDFTSTCNELIANNITTDIQVAISILASRIRNQVREKTGLEASVGSGPNVLLAKIALRIAKPSGQKYISSDRAVQELDNILIEDLPGVGYHISKKLFVKLNVKTAGQIRSCKKSSLESLLGTKTATKLYDYSFGIDSTDITKIPGPKSIGVEIAWAVRLKNEQEVDLFLSNLALEFCKRMENANVKGKYLILKIYQRCIDAPIEPPKYLGCGRCDSYSKSYVLDESTRDHLIITKEVQRLIRTFECPWTDLRGVGIQMKLEEVEEEAGDHKKKQRTISQAIRESVRSNTAQGTSSIVVPLSSTTSIMDTTITTNKTVDNDGDDDVGEIRTSSFIPPTLKQKKKLIPILPKPKRNYTTFTQLTSKIDLNVLNELPTQIKNEIIQDQGLYKTKVQRPTRSDNLTLPHYQPINFYGLINPSEIRSYVAKWIDSTFISGPLYEDVCIFEMYFLNIINHDSNWNKSIQLLKWMTSYINFKQSESQSQSQWPTLISIYYRIACQTLLTKRGIRIS